MKASYLSEQASEPISRWNLFTTAYVWTQYMIGLLWETSQHNNFTTCWKTFEIEQTLCTYIIMYVGYIIYLLGIVDNEALLVFPGIEQHNYTTVKLKILYEQ